MTQPLPASQIQNNSVGNATVGGDFIFNPTQIIKISVAEVTQRELIKFSPYCDKRLNSQQQNMG